MQRVFPSAAEILAADDLPFEDVPVPEFGAGATIRVKAITAEERDEFEQSWWVAKGKDRVENRRNITARLVAIAAINPDTGLPLFTPHQVAALGRKNAKALNRLYAVASRLAGLSRDDVEELLGNSVGDRNGDSPSGSPCASDAPSASCSGE